MELNQTITLSPDVISQEVSGETVILDLNSENYFGLDEVGTRIWQLVEETGNLQQVYDRMLAEYEVDEEQLLEDMGKLILEIEKIGLVSLQPGSTHAR
jgi:Coenzyme PQQ synthesis protein D (PqqD)